MAYKDPEAKRKAWREWYARNREREGQRARANTLRRREESRQKLLAYLLEHPCSCGEADPLVLQFHHLGEKECEIADAFQRHWSWKRIEAELKKCEVVCANCHARLSAQQAGNWKIAALAQLARASAL